MPFKSQLEIFVERYVFNVSKFNTLRTKKNLIIKALYMIDAQLGIPCCDDPLAVTSYTREDDILTNFLRSYFGEQFNVRKNLNSLRRVKKLLSIALGRYIADYPYATVDEDDLIVDTCCLVTFRFADLFNDAELDIANFTVSLIDSNSGDVVIPAVSWVFDAKYQIPKGTYYLQFVRSVAYVGIFDTMVLSSKFEPSGAVIGRFIFPADPIDQLGIHNSIDVDIQSDLKITYDVATSPSLLFTPPV